MLTYAHVCSRMLTYAHVCSRMPTYADVCRRMFTYAHVCCRMLTYADVCSRMLTYADVYTEDNERLLESIRAAGLDVPTEIHQVPPPPPPLVTRLKRTSLYFRREMFLRNVPNLGM